MATDYEYWKRQVRAATVLGEGDRALDLLDQGMHKHGKRPGCQLFAGEIFSAAGQSMEALQCFDTAIEQDKGNLEAILCSAVLLSQLGYYDEAQLRFKCAMELDHDGGLKLYGKAVVSPGVSLAEQKHRCMEILRWAKEAWTRDEKEEALAHIEKSLALMETPEARLLLAQCQLIMDQPVRALENLEAGRKLNPTLADFQTLAARCFLALGRVKQAKDSMLRAELLGDQSLAGRSLQFEAKSW